MSTVETVSEAMNEIAPLDAAAAWDNVGLLVGGRRWSAKHVMLTIDLTRAVLDEAIAAKTNMIIAYHPVIFEPLRTVSDASEKSALVLDAIGAGIAIYSPHTALDAAPEGVNDWLARGFGDGVVRALEPQPTQPRSEHHKIVTFCPETNVDVIRLGMARAGAGRIGAYEQCSFELHGEGTFLGGAETHPATGDPAGTLARVNEVRLEMVCGSRALPAAIVALRESHPYEEPPIEIHDLAARPALDRGQGRITTLHAARGLKSIVAELKPHLGVKHIEVAVASSAPRRYRTIAVCAGAGGSMLEGAIAQGAELFLTGEMRHHDVLAGQAAGCTVVLAGHTNTERGYLKVLRRRLQRALPKTSIAIARRDAHPLKVM